MINYPSAASLRLHGARLLFPPVATLLYLPYCFFNLISPLMSITMAAIGFKIKQHHEEDQSIIVN